MNQDIFTLEEGQVVLQWPATLSADGYEDFKDWLKLIARKAGRGVKADDGTEVSTDLELDE
jgi:hypothetical protein